MWIVSVVSIWVPLNSRAMPLALAAAATATVTTVVLWVAYRLRDRDKDALVKAMADFSLRRAQAPTRPLRRVS